jgi:hypothetical protein
MMKLAISETSKSDRWLTQLAGLQAKACLLRHPHEDPSLLSSVVRALKQSSQMPGFLSIKSITFRDHFFKY